MPVVLREPYETLTFYSPLSRERADRLVRFLAAGLVGTVLDLGCGWAELLLQVVAAAPGGRGAGIDSDGDALARGRAQARARGLEDRVELLAADARTDGPDVADAIICVGASQIWGPPVEAGEPLDYATALAALRGRVVRGGRVVYGEGIWSRPPTAEAAAPLANRLDEFVPLAELVELAVAAGFQPVEVGEATQDEWDVFESGYSARFAHWLAEHGDDHPDADEVRARAARQRAAYFGGYRRTLGMAYLALRAV